MLPNVAYIYSDDFSRYDLGPSHPMNSKRIKVSHKLLQDLGMFEKSSTSLLPVTIKKPASEKDIQSVHTEEYVNEVKRLSKEPGFNPKMGLGTGDCPVFDGMYDISALIVGSALLGVDLVINQDYSAVFMPMGGLHHAFPNKASGFCYFNDVAIVIKKLLTLGFRVAYIDTDLHHGDGVQAIFNSEPNVLTFDMHESGQFIFPSTGYPDEFGTNGAEGTKVNFPLYLYTYDELYINIFKRYLPLILNQYKPDIIVWQAGLDAHYRDPMGHLMLSSHTYKEIATIIHQLAEQTSTKKLIVGAGGGYNPTSAARGWAVELAVLTGFNLPTMCPSSWLDYCKNMYDLTPIDTIHDHMSTPDLVEEHYSINPKRIIAANKTYEKNFYEIFSKYYFLG